MAVLTLTEGGAVPRATDPRLCPTLRSQAPEAPMHSEAQDSLVGVVALSWPRVGNWCRPPPGGDLFRA